MPRRLTCISLALVLLLAGEVWALGLGEVRLESALNQPLRAEIELLAASPEELENLRVTLASPETFARYGLDRPMYLQDLSFEVVRSGRADGNYVRVRSQTPMSEPFLTFLVEASWPRGRLLREYTVLLDPPTYAPPASSAPQVTAPTQTRPADTGRIERTQQPAPRPAPPPATSTPRATPPAERAPVEEPPKPAPVADDTPYDTASGDDYVVNRGETLWGIAMATRPDSRLSINQTMLAIYEANPQAFAGNINILRAGASLRIPSADEIYNIDRRDATSEVQRQHSAWSGAAPVAPPRDEAPVEDTRPSLTLVPPDEDVDVGTGVDADAEPEIVPEPLTREEELVQRIAEIEAADVPEQRSLIEIRDNELAALRRELAEIRGEVYEPPPEPVSDDPFVDADEVPAEDAAPGDEVLDDIVADDAAVEEPADATTTEPVAADADEAAEPAPATTSRRRPQPSFLDQVMGYLKNIWVLIGAALLAVLGLLVWFLRRGGGTDEPEAWGGALDADELSDDLGGGTETLRAPTREDESFVVVEQESQPEIEPTVETPAIEEAAPGPSLDDTFSSETAVNLDQSDPIAEADFHMAYGLYDQAADLINGALQVEPERQDLLTKLCEIYFVWGNRDAFIDAAERLQAVTGGDSADWDKIVIMGQQIASDHALFAGAGVAGATKAVDLSFEGDAGGEGALDMDFGGDDAGGDDVIDLGGGDDDIVDLGAGGDDDVIDLGAGGDDDGLDFVFDDSAATAEVPTMEQSTIEPTVEMPGPDDTVESPTIDQPSPGLEGTAELPSIEEDLEAAIAGSGQGSDATAEINLDDLGLDLGDLDETEVATLDDLDATGTNEALSDLASVTGKNPQVDPDATGVQHGIDGDMLADLDSTSEMLSPGDETGQNPIADNMDDATDVSVEDPLREATGHTQVLPEDMAVETITDGESLLSDEDATLLSPGLGGDSDSDAEFDFAKTEALPKDAFAGDGSLEETSEMPAVASTDVDLDLDDLTAALKVSEIGDTVDMARDDATVEQPRPSMDAETVELSPDEMSDDLADARTMTEVGTKLDLARAYVDMGDPQGAKSILEEVLQEGDEGQRQQAQQLLDSLPS